MALGFAGEAASQTLRAGGILHCGPGMTRFAAPRLSHPRYQLSVPHASSQPYLAISYWLLVVVVGLVEEAPRRLPGSYFEEAQGFLS